MSDSLTSFGALCPAARIGRSQLSQLCLILMLAGHAISATGCASFSVFRRPHPQYSALPRPRFSQDPQLEEVVDHLNRNVNKLHGWRASSIKIRANNLPGLSGSLVVEENQHLRMFVNSPMGHEVDMGSNDDVFWVWAKRMEPQYVFCRHEQIDVARQSLGVPFEPQWLMQALGVAPLETQGLEMQVDPVSRQARLIQPMVSAHGQTLQKVMMVDLANGVITEHSIFDARGQKMAQALMSDFRVDKQSGAVLPHRVRLEWPQSQMILVMNLGQIDVNPKGIPSQTWDMPSMRGVQVVDLGKSAQPGIRFAEVPEQQNGVSDQGYQLHEPEDTWQGADSGRVQMTLDESEENSEVPVRRPLSTATNRSKNSQPKTNWFDE